METGQPPARPASALDAAMTRLQHAIVAVVMAGGALTLLWGLLPYQWPQLAATGMHWNVISVSLLVALFAGFALALLLPRLHRLKRLVARNLAELERSRAALETGNRELQAMAGRLFSVQEDERRAISRDLHDDIGQAITAMKLSAHAAMGEEDGARRLEDLQALAGLADATLDKLRNLSTLLRPPQLDALGLEAALRWHAGVLLRNSPVHLRLDIQPLRQRPHREVEQACFRIAQEGLTNVLRHARASRVEFAVLREGAWLRVSLQDDGAGAGQPSAQAGCGFGLAGMAERIEGLGGEFCSGRAAGGGFRIEARLPAMPNKTIQESVHEQ